MDLPRYFRKLLQRLEAANTRRASSTCRHRRIYAYSIPTRTWLGSNLMCTSREVSCERCGDTQVVWTHVKIFLRTFDQASSTVREPADAPLSLPTARCRFQLCCAPVKSLAHCCYDSHLDSPECRNLELTDFLSKDPAWITRPDDYCEV